MKIKIKRLSIACALILMGSFYVNAQNHFWSLPHNYLIEGVLGDLPTPIPYQVDLTYNNEFAQHAHNAIAKPNGDLVFFVVDDRVYDKDGYVMYIFGHGSSDVENVHSNSEICIVPDPASCGERFYIFTSNAGIDGAFYHPYGTILDLEAPSVSNIHPDSLLGGPAFGGFDSENIKKMNELAAFENTLGELENFNGNHDHPYLFAASPKMQDSSHFVIFSDGAAIHRMRIDETGMHPINPPLSIGNIVPGYGINNNGWRSELELIQLDSLTFRIGISTTASGSGSVVAAFDVDLNGNYNGGTAFAHTLSEPSSDLPHVKGLEFSKNGRYLYFTHHQSPNNPDAVQYLDLDSLTAHTLNVPNDGDFQYSQIELGLYGKLYFAYANGLATLADSDDPNSTWTAPFYSFSNNLSNAEYPGQEKYYSYLLPDQMDGMNYSDIFDYPYDVVSVSGVDTWTADNNPFSNDTSLVRIREELRIESGAHITIEKMRFEFFEDARVVIEPGARLTLDSTTFTIGPCFAKMWLGVEVHGNPEASQIQVANQGFLDLKNNSVIEHAYIGAIAGSREGGFNSNSFAYEKPGGIIKAIDSRFRNNRRDVLLQDYIWENNGNLVTNLSSFINCDFVTDRLLNHSEIFPETHAYLYRVHSVSFKNCSFRNTASFFDHAIEDRGAGIVSIYSTFSVRGSNEIYEQHHDTLDIEENAHQTFYRLNTGVLSYGQENHHFTVDQMEFQLNQMGIQVFGSCFENITFNNFQVPEANPAYPNENVGARIMNSYLFTIEENTFFGDQETTRNAGLVLDNTSKGWGPDDAEVGGAQPENEVYRNDFAHLEMGIVVENDNRGQNDNAGLQARCNTFTNNNRADIYLDEGTEWRDDQGSLNDVTLLTNNVFSFSNPPCGSQYRDVRVNDDYGSEQDPPSLFFQYHCLDDAVTEPAMDHDHSSCPQDHIQVNNQTFPNVTLDYQEHCPSNFSPGGGIKWPLVELEEKQATAENNLASAKAVYKATIDGGKTEDVVDLLENILNEESTYLRDLLMQRYPLSRQALMAALDAAESFDPWHLTQVLVANAPLPADVYRFLATNDVLSPFFFQFVEDAQANGGVNLGRLLYAEISLRSYEKSHAERALHRHYLYHPDSLDGTAWSDYLESRDEPFYQLYRLGEYVDQAETGAAQALLDSLGLIEDRTQWVQFMIDLAAADTVTANDLYTGWDFFYNAPATRGDAWGWLTLQGELDSLPPLPEIIDRRSFSLISAEDATNAERWLEAWPNPAKDRVVLTYPREADGTGTVQVFGPKGEFIREFAASDVGFQEINLTDWSPGLYVAKLIVNAKTIDTVKISVVR